MKQKTSKHTKVTKKARNTRKKTDTQIAKRLGVTVEAVQDARSRAGLIFDSIYKHQQTLPGPWEIDTLPRDGSDDREGSYDYTDGLNHGFAAGVEHARWDAENFRILARNSSTNDAYERGRSAGWAQGYADAVNDADEAERLEHADAKVENLERLLAAVTAQVNDVIAQHAK